MIKILQLTKKGFIVFLLTTVLLLRTTAAFADDSTDPSAAPTPPAQPTAPQPPSQPIPPAAPAAPTVPNNPINSSAPTTNSNGTTPATPTDPTTPNNGTNSLPTSPNNTQATSSQQNTGKSNTGLTQNTTTGNNTSSDNVGNAMVASNNANASGTVLNGVNTNMGQVSVSQFTVAGDHNGDIILDIPANCVLNCTTGNTITTAQNTATTNTQQNTAGVGNMLTLSANSGNNNASQNTSGNSAITTGNANVDANSLAFANNNFDGQVEFAVVNIDGNLNGDIILPQSAVASICTQNCGTSTNTQTTSGQQNGAAITNTIKTSATTGNNTTSENTNGNNNIQTGQGSVDANSLTLANNNFDGGTYWLVLVNNNGNWNGQIVGSNGNTASSPGLNFTFTPDGNIATTNNGAGSQNTTTVTDNVGSTNTQANTATVNNTLDLSANTGGNNTDQNTGGASSITTGNAKIMANLVDFVNNNLSHGAKLIVTIVNVFGTWTGDFLTPGQNKQSNNSTPQASSGSVHTESNVAQAQTADPTPQVTPIGDPAPQPPMGLQIPPASSVLAAINTPNTPLIHIAGMQYPITNTKALKTLQINLAWLVIILPLLAVGNILRRKIVSFRKRVSS